VLKVYILIEGEADTIKEDNVVLEAKATARRQRANRCSARMTDQRRRGQTYLECNTRDDRRH
jgi:hypothetical protein